MFEQSIGPVIAGCDALKAITPEMWTTPYPRPLGERPSEDANPLGAWFWKGDIPGAASGPLSGKTVAIKDSIAVAGFPLSNGTRLLEGYIAPRDATVVERVLNAGATIKGKSMCENMCLSGSSFTSDYGIVRNPFDTSRSAGGSSSGNAVLIATGAVDMGIGGDQAGSIRIPSSWCGIYGLKPTWGLIPYTGAISLEPTIDHLGPMARNVTDLAQLLTVMAGPDGLDPRQNSTPYPPTNYAENLRRGIEELRIGVLQEGFGWENSDPAVDTFVRQQIEALASLGAQVTPVSVPDHRQAMVIFNGIAMEGGVATMMVQNGQLFGQKAFSSPDLAEFWGRAWHAAPDALPYMVKQFMLTATFVNSRYQGGLYAKAQNMARALRFAYDCALKTVDVIMMPTLPMTASKLPGPGASLSEILQATSEMLFNTAPFDVTGHPAITIPCGMLEGLPVGMMAVGPMGADDILLRLAYAAENSLYRQPLP